MEGGLLVNRVHQSSAEPPAEVVQAATWSGQTCLCLILWLHRNPDQGYRS